MNYDILLYAMNYDIQLDHSGDIFHTGIKNEIVQIIN